jgi:hypothetical protein
MAGSVSSVRTSDIKKSVTMKEIIFMAMMMINMSAMIKSHRSTRDDSIELFI